MLKKCFFCGSPNVVRNGVRGRKQLYKCKDCGRQFLGARHTFICVALELGIPTTVIRKITGHADEAAMRPYIAITDKTIHEAMDLFSRRGE